MAQRTSVGTRKLAQLPSHVWPVMYDSPLKSRQDIVRALDANAVLHVDNFQELEVVKDVVAKMDAQKAGRLTIGMRVNPQVGAGTLEGYSTATLTSKFGVGLKVS